MTATAAASVGVTTPPLIPPMMMTGSSSTGAQAQSARRISRAEAAVPETEADRFVRARVEEAGPGRVRVLPQNPLSTSGPSAYAESVGGYNGVRLEIFEDYLTETLPDDETAEASAASRARGAA